MLPLLRAAVILLFMKGLDFKINLQKCLAYRNVILSEITMSKQIFLFLSLEESSSSLG